jgi:SAM-dependent methyltransferase
MNHKWTVVDGYLRSFRLNKIKRYIRTGSVLCDLGCGQDAFLLRYFSPVIKNGFGFDPLVKDFREGNLFVQKSALSSEISLENNSVDVVSILAALEHFDNEEQILREVNRILRKDGVLLITVPTYYNKPLLELLGFLGVINRAEILDHKRYYYKKNLEDVLQETGFESKFIRVKYWQLGLNLFARAIK